MEKKVRVKTVAATLIIILGILTVVAFSNAELLKRRIDRIINGESSVEQAKEEASAVYGVVETPFGTRIGNHLNAFESDATFFDASLTAAEQLLMESGRNTLSLILTSVERDMRIQIVDAVGKPVQGYSFFVTLVRNGDPEPAGQYKDLDRDGVIYVADLNPGDYEAWLSPMEDYETPETATRIRVKAKVEYTPISDIALLIRSEEEIDPLLEDTETKEPEEEGGTAPDAGAFPGGRGIDVSKYQKEIDWEKVKASGISFAILRCGYRGSKTGCLVEDPFFERNLKAAKEAGIELGLYFFTQAVNEVEAVEEASMVLALLGDAELTYPIYIDTEGAGGGGRADVLDPDTRTAVCRAFCKTIEAAGHRAGIYASRNWWNNNLKSQELSDYETWLAEYTDEPKYEGHFSLWQYTSRGKVDGITGNVDLDLALEW